MDAITFNQRVKHGRCDFHPTIVYGFEDPDAAPYFKAAGWAKDSKDEVQVVITLGEVDIDPDTVFADGPNQGKKVVEA